jgi:membrane-associated protease RseP (regulator of RpoE activity)
MNWDLISAVIFYSLLALLIVKYRKKIQIMDKIFIVYKTKKGLNLMRNLARYRVFWKIFSTVAIPVAFLGMIIVGQSLLSNLIMIFKGTGGQGVSLLIPGVKIPGSSFYVPFWPGIIAIAVLAVVHEFSHGIVAAMEGIRLKSTGFGLLAFLPLAFVELDEKQMARKSKLARMRVAAAGPFANIVTWAVLIAFVSFVLAPMSSSFIVSDGLNITNVVPNSPAESAGLSVGMVITKINNYTITDVQSFKEAISSIHPNENVSIVASNQTYTILTSTNPSNNSKPYIGIFMVPVTHISDLAKEKYEALLDVFMWIYQVIWWVAMINLFVGLINFIPVWAIDGSRIFYDTLGYVIKSEKIRAIILHFTSSFYLGLIVLNFIGPYIMHMI